MFITIVKLFTINNKLRVLSHHFSDYFRAEISYIKVRKAIFNDIVSCE